MFLLDSCIFVEKCQFAPSERCFMTKPIEKYATKCR